MDGAFDVLEFIEYLRSRWSTVLIACSAAVVLALGASLILPKRYTSTATILIQPPAGNDVRATTAMSPVYLESLRKYERFASSSTLFSRALDHIDPAPGGRRTSVESLRKKVLKVSKQNGTNVLEISATWDDPKQAQALAQYVAEQTASLNKYFDDESQKELTTEFRTQFDAARTRLTAARQALNAFSATDTRETLENEVRDHSELKYRLERDLALARTDLADYTAQLGASQAGNSDAANSAELDRRVASARARIQVVEQQSRETGELLDKEAARLEKQSNERAALDHEVQSAQTAFETANTRLNEILSSSQFRGERLEVIDPGAVPQQPTFPNTPLNVVVAFIFALAGSLVYLACRVSYRRLEQERADRAYSLR